MGSGDYRVVQHRGQLLAVVEAWVSQDEVAETIGQSLDRVHDWLPRSGVRAGQNVAVYDSFGPGGMRMRAGVQVDRSFASSSEITCFELPPGRAATVRYVGSYDGLFAAQACLRDWCSTESLTFDDMSWEVYGDWTNDESQLVTDISIAVR